MLPVMEMEITAHITSPDTVGPFLTEPLLHTLHHSDNNNQVSKITQWSKDKSGTPWALEALRDKEEIRREKLQAWLQTLSDRDNSATDHPEMLDQEATRGSEKKFCSIISTKTWLSALSSSINYC